MGPALAAGPVKAIVWGEPAPAGRDGKVSTKPAWAAVSVPPATVIVAFSVFPPLGSVAPKLSDRLSPILPTAEYEGSEPATTRSPADASGPVRTAGTF